MYYKLFIIEVNDWSDINLYIRDYNFAEYISDKMKSNIPNVVICGSYHTKGIKKNLKKLGNNIYPFMVDNQFILKAIEYYNK